MVSNFKKCAIIFAVSIILTSCKPPSSHEKKFSFHAKFDQEKIPVLLSDFSTKNGYKFTSGNFPGEKSRDFMIDGHGIRIIVQSAFDEQCIRREGRRKVSYSKNTFNVNVFSTSFFSGEETVNSSYEQLRNVLIKSKIDVFPREDICKYMNVASES